MSKRPPPHEDYLVGNCRPPKAHQFRPGQSGNPRGRPKGARSIGAILKSIMAKRVWVTENGRRHTVSRLELICLRLVSDASRGEARATKQLLEFIDRYGDRSESVARSEEISAEDREILADYLRRADKAVGGGGSSEGEGEDGEGV